MNFVDDWDETDVGWSTLWHHIWKTLDDLWFLYTNDFSDRFFQLMICIQKTSKNNWCFFHSSQVPLCRCKMLRKCSGMCDVPIMRDRFDRLGTPPFFESPPFFEGGGVLVSKLAGWPPPNWEGEGGGLLEGGAGGTSQKAGGGGLKAWKLVSGV